MTAVTSNGHGVLEWSGGSAPIRRWEITHHRDSATVFARISSEVGGPVLGEHCFAKLLMAGGYCSYAGVVSQVHVYAEDDISATELEVFVGGRYVSYPPLPQEPLQPPPPRRRIVFEDEP